MIIKRLMAFIIDLLIIAVIMGILFAATQTINSQFLTQFFSALMVTLLLCKDCINGQSVGKRIMKIQVVDAKTGTEVSNVKCIVRNLFVIFWIVEVFVLVVSNNKRIGDYAAKTKVISNSKAPKIQFDKNTLIAVLLCFCVSFLFAFLVFNLFRSSMFQLLV